jgi:Uma2 family endonuclease
MGMPDLAKIWTLEEVLALPDDGNRYELVDGELLVSPSPRGRHQRAVLELYRIVDPYVRLHRLGYTALAPADIDLKARQRVQPDLFVGGLIDGRRPVDWPEYGVPILIAEVLSPSTARYDRITKRNRYQRSGVDPYWIVDLDARLVEVWRPSDERPRMIDDQLAWQPDPALAPLTIDLPAYFREVWSD